MLKSSLFKSPYQLFHFNFEFNYPRPLQALNWALLCALLKKYIQVYPALEIHALVLMDTHVHMIFRISAGHENYFTNQVLADLKFNYEYSDQMLAEPITNRSQYLNTYKYVYRNPVEAGICKNCEDYPYSSLHSLLGRSNMDLIVSDKMGLIQNPMKILGWLNSAQKFKQSYLKEVFQENSFLM